jgi:hypothetical protein
MGSGRITFRFVLFMPFALLAAGCTARPEAYYPIDDLGVELYSFDGEPWIFGYHEFVTVWGDAASFVRGSGHWSGPLEGPTIEGPWQRAGYLRDRHEYTVERTENGLVLSSVEPCDGRCPDEFHFTRMPDRSLVEEGTGVTWLPAD